ncbi:hypothetical protein [Pseudomonas zeae]|uniref:hypothetical protein n=1 Tax=Pseudomonas zeae TaxID=2745510 RepID=UPI0039DFB7B4
MGLSQTATVHLKKAKRTIAGRNFDGEPTISLALGSNSRNHFELTLLRANLKEGYTVNSARLSRPEVLLSTQWYGTRYEQSVNHLTHVSLEITSLTEQEAVIVVSGTLVNPESGAHLTVSPSTISIRGAHLKQLLAGQTFGG